MEIELGTTALLGFENKGQNANLKKKSITYYNANTA